MHEENKVMFVHTHLHLRCKHVVIIHLCVFAL